MMRARAGGGLPNAEGRTRLPDSLDHVDIILYISPPSAPLSEKVNVNDLVRGHGCQINTDPGCKKRMTRGRGSRSL